MKLSIVPPLNVMSPSAKSEDGSDNVNVIVAVSPTFNAEILEAIPIVGSVVSTVIDSPVEGSDVLPA